MNTQITITIPEKLYRRAKKLAQSLKKEVDVVLAESIQLDDAPPAYANNEDEAVERERIAFLNMHTSLWKKYPLEHVAIYQGELVDHALDGEALSKRIYQAYPGEFVLMRQVTDEAEPVIYFRSPRFVRESK